MRGIDLLRWNGGDALVVELCRAWKSKLASGLNEVFDKGGGVVFRWVMDGTGDAI